MKIAFDVSPLSSGHKDRGIGIYTTNLLEELKKIGGLEIQEFTHLDEVGAADLVHYPYFDLFRATLPLKKKFKTIVTVHDVIPLLFPEHYPPGIKGNLLNLYQRLSLKSCSGVITDSNCSRIDISRILGVDKNKIFTIYLATSNEFKKVNDKQFLKELREKYNLPEKYILYYGGVNWNKNLFGVAETARSLDYDLVLVGKGFEKRDNLDHPELRSFNDFLEKFAKDTKIHILGFIPLKDLVVTINLAQVVLSPSFYEGFGLTVLESQACGTPVVTSKTSSLPEISKDSAMLVDPYNITEIKETTEQVLKDKALRESLIKKGFLNVKRFSWKKVAQETFKLYEQIFFS